MGLGEGVRVEAEVEVEVGVKFRVKVAKLAKQRRLWHMGTVLVYACCVRIRRTVG